jgi:hypothetical protein
MALVASVPAVAALTATAKKPRVSIDALLDQLPPEVAAEMRAKFHAIFSQGLERLRAGGNRAEIFASMRADIRAV